MTEQLRRGPGAFLKPKRKCHPSDINSSNSKYIVCVKTKQKQNKTKKSRLAGQGNRNKDASYQICNSKLFGNS